MSTGNALRVCSWCGAILELGCPDKVTHAMCPRCAERSRASVVLEETGCAAKAAEEPKSAPEPTGSRTRPRARD